MSKYKKYSSLATQLYKENPSLSSDSIAVEISNRFPDDEINTSSLGRAIRKYNWIESPTKENKNPAKILLFDLETLPYEVRTRVWSLWNQNINAKDIVKDFCVVTWAAKWLFEDEVMSMKMTPKEALERNDKRLMEGIHKLIDEANVVIAHNLDKYDNKVFQARLFANGIFRPSPYSSIDTLKVSRQMFGNKLGSNRLDFIAQHVLGIEGKQETPKGLWDKCCEGDKDSIRIMDEYCVQDVRVLEDVYLAMRPYIKNHPNIGLYVGSSVHVCPNCGSNHLVWKGSYRTAMNEYDSFQCNDCGTWGRSRNSSVEKQTRDRLTKGI